MDGQFGTSFIHAQKKFNNVFRLTDSVERRLEIFVEKKEFYLNGGEELIESDIQFKRRFTHPFLRRLTAVRLTTDLETLLYATKL